MWKEILTVYAVKTTTGTENSMDAVTMDEAHFAVLQEIFWDMNSVTYARNQKRYLNAFMHHGEVDISNNIAESAIRPFVVGRKNWLFCDTPKGADSRAIAYPLTETAKANDVEPFAYLSYVLHNMRYLSKTPAATELKAMMPWNSGLRAKLGTI